MPTLYMVTDFFVDCNDTNRVVRNWIGGSYHRLESEVRMASFASHLLYSQGCDAARGFV